MLPSSSYMILIVPKICMALDDVDKFWFMLV